MRREFSLPGGLSCQACGQPLIGVEHTRTSEGFIFRERRCRNPACRHLNITTERIITTRPPTPYRQGLLWPRG